MIECWYFGIMHWCSVNKGVQGVRMGIRVGVVMTMGPGVGVVVTMGTGVGMVVTMGQGVGVG